MSLFVASLASGSNGNCYYVGNSKEAVLIDAGISCREIERRMKRLNLPVERVKAIFISHEHSDHIRGLSVFTKKYLLPVYITPPTLSNSRLQLAAGCIRSFQADRPVKVGELSITAFRKYHDAIDPYSFVVEYNGTRTGVFTDLGRPCNGLATHFSRCHAAFLESNYDEEMLEKGNYPYHLKKRISGGLGHLSNKQALDVFLQKRSPQLSHLFLTHLSNNNNRPEIVEELFNLHAEETKIIVASRFCETAVYQVGANAEINYVIPGKKVAVQGMLDLEFR